MHVPTYSFLLFLCFIKERCSRFVFFFILNYMVLKFDTQGFHGVIPFGVERHDAQCLCLLEPVPPLVFPKPACVCACLAGDVNVLLLPPVGAAAPTPSWSARCSRHYGGQNAPRNLRKHAESLEIFLHTIRAVDLLHFWCTCIKSAVPSKEKKKITHLTPHQTMKMTIFKKAKETKRSHI